MFDTFSFSLFNNLPNLPDIDVEECRRLLSKAYLFAVERRLDLVQTNFNSINLEELSEEEIDLIEDIIDENPDGLFEGIYIELRKFGDALESSAIFDNLDSDETRKSAAFVAAEALSLLSTLLRSEGELNDKEEFMFSNEVVYTRIEAAMLYLIAGYDANAQTEINEVLQHLNTFDPNQLNDDVLQAEFWAMNNIINLCINRLWNIERTKPQLFSRTHSYSLKSLIRENKYQMYSLLGEAIINYIDWLTGDNSEGLEESLSYLKRINESSYKNKYALYPELFHLSKVIMVMINETSKRSLLHKTPSPSQGEGEFLEYLKLRVKGDAIVSSRPFIWESAKEFISECLPGPHKHTIVNLPTGSGKSFIAELAIAQSISTGWVLYIAPTNALVHQIKRDLKKSLRSFDSLDIRTFVGGDEYTTLENEFLDEQNDSYKFVAVMTPEKCAMSLRVNPEVFQNCSLCIFDECHLLGEGTRGATVDLVLGQILSIRSDIKFILMSAMLSNPDDLSDWLENVTANETKISSISWKPTRSIRGAVGIEYDSYLETKQLAKERLSEKNESRRNEKFDPSLSVLFSLSGIWGPNYRDYSLMNLKTTAKYTLSRENSHDRWLYTDAPNSWVNQTSKSLGVELASKGVSTIVFIPSNRHYPFSLAKNLNLNVDNSSLNEMESNFLFLAEKELGVESEVKKLLEQYKTGVHTAYMLDTEKEAVERMFINQDVKLLFATGTLAQGLNLPSVAVVIAGTRVGDAREAYTPEAQIRAKALILNAIGRAGRAGFSNQSLSLLVPNEPLIYKQQEADVYNAISKLNVLQDRDASIRVRSPLEGFLDSVINGALQADRASLQELSIMSMLTSDNEGEDVEKTKNILNKTYAASKIKQNLNQEKLEAATLAITQIKKEFLEESKAPDWVITVARKTGFDFFTVNLFFKIVNKILSEIDVETMLEWDLQKWNNLLFYCMRELPPYYIERFLPETPSKKLTFTNKMRKALKDLSETDIQWEKPNGWDSYWEEFSQITWLYMQGKTYAEIAIAYLKVEGPVEVSRTAGKPIPDVIALIKNQIEKISSYAGLLVAILEEALYKESDIPFNLNGLPIAIKNGLNNHSSLYWYGYAMRNRIVAHILALNFPLGNFIDEETSKRIVFQQKRNWLRDELDLSHLNSEEKAILEAARRIIQNA